jgi:hypothetical protein
VTAPRFTVGGAQGADRVLAAGEAVRYIANAVHAAAALAASIADGAHGVEDAPGYARANNNNNINKTRQQQQQQTQQQRTQQQKQSARVGEEGESKEGGAELERRTISSRGGPQGRRGWITCGTRTGCPPKPCGPVMLRDIPFRRACKSKSGTKAKAKSTLSQGIDTAEGRILQCHTKQRHQQQKS